LGIVLITGCSSGFGLEAALAFAGHGDTVIATMRDIGRADGLLGRASDAGFSIEVTSLDVNDDVSVTAAVDGVIDRHGVVDVLVNNAGVSFTGAIETMDLGLARQVLETNYWGTVRMIQAVLPQMRQRGDGVIINVSSIAGRIPPLPFSSWYAVSKHAVCLLSEALFMELMGTGVRVVSVEPGFHRTAIASNSAAHVDGEYAAEEEWVASFYEAGVRNGEDPSDVADAIVEASTDPTTPLHLTVPRFLESTIPARAGATFEETAASQISNLEATVGPRPVRPSLRARE
jgi:NAD(P)-dependent dehydrogenase (short-subunit alcohol dehydrogenase family)